MASLTSRVLTLVLGVELGLGLLTFTALLHNAREAVVEELAASERLAVSLVRATMAAVISAGPPVEPMKVLADRLPEARHVRFLVVDARGDLQPTTSDTRRVTGTGATGLLAAWLAVPVRVSEIAVVVNGRTYGKILVLADPRDEIAEVWQDLREILVIGGLGLVLLALAIWATTAWALEPLHHLRDALERARSGNTDIRLETPMVRELVPLVQAFNALMHDLGRARAEREELTRRLVAAEDRERRALALELHDEMGPCLFALRAEIAGLVRAIRENPTRHDLQRRCDAILHVSRALEEAQRRVLGRLRPIRAPGMTFTQQLEELLSDCAAHAETPAWHVWVDPSVDRAGEVTQVTVYRLLQEAVTNVLRHAGASRVQIEVTREHGEVHVTVADDGRGFVAPRPDGIGLHGMRERVQGLGGRFEIVSHPGRGTVIRAWIPDPEEGTDVRAGKDPETEA